MGVFGAKCFHTFSQTERELDKFDWDFERVGMVCTRSENFANWKASILKMCREQRCSRELLETIDHLARSARRSVTFEHGN